MGKVVCKLFWIHQYDEEEKWLNEMASKGLIFSSVKLFRYKFDDCEPGTYNVRLELLGFSPKSQQGKDYISFVEETGAEYIGSYMNWVYFRKKKSLGELNLNSDLQNRVQQLKRILRVLYVALAAEIVCFVAITIDYLNSIQSKKIGGIVLISILIVIFIRAIISTLKKRRILEKECMLYE